MRSTLLFIAAVVLFVTPASAQLLLTQSSFPATTTWGASTAGIGDSVATSYTSTGLPTNLGSRTAGAIWNFSGMSYYTTDTSAVIHSVYTGFSYQDFALHIIAKPYLYFDARSLMNINTSGLTKFGEKLDGRGYSLTAATGGPTDSLIFPQQVDTFSAVQTKMPFPATFNTVWSSTYNSTVKFTLSVAALSYNHTPCTAKLFVTEKDSVIGYGKVVVKRIDNQFSDSISALEVKVTYHEVDSFYINGAVASSVILNQFGLTQGQTVNSTNEYRYMRANETTPLADVFYTDNTFSTVGQVYIHTQRIPLYTAVPVVTAQNSINVYPNPVIDRAFTMHIPSALQGAVYRVVNIAGQIVTADIINTTGEVSVQLPANAITGMYYLQIFHNGNAITTKALEVK